MKIKPTKNAVVCLIVAVGVILRAALYLHNRSFWLDEAYLALNIIHRNFAALLAPLEYHQAAPPLFLIAVKLMQQLFGNSEYALRAVPFLAGIISIPLFYLLLRRLLAWEAALFGLLLFAVAPPLVLYSSELKPYSSDILATILLLCPILAILNGDRRRKQIFLFALAALIVPWFSYPSIFVSAGCAVTLLLYLVKNDRPLLKLALGLALFCAANLLLLYFLHLKKAASDKFLDEYWAIVNGFPLTLPLSLRSLVATAQNLSANIKEIPLYFKDIQLPVFLIILGCLSLYYSKNLYTLLLLLLIPAVVGAASVLHKYPVYHRVLLFLVPVVYLLVAFGVDLLVKSLAQNRKAISYLLMAAVLAYPVIGAIAPIARPYQKEDIKSALQYLQEKHKEGDRFYIYGDALPAYKYYKSINGKFDFDDHQPIEGLVLPREGLTAMRLSYQDRLRFIEHVQTHYEKEADRLSSLRNSRLWVLVSHTEDEREAVLAKTLSRLGKQTDKKLFTGASVYLYEIGGNSPAGIQAPK